MSINSFQGGLLTDIIMRLDLALENLPAAPDLSIADLEIAWQLLLQGLPAGPTAISEDSDESFTFTPTLTEIVEGTPEATAEFTVTPSLTVTPTP